MPGGKSAGMDKPTVAVLGATGMLGHKLFQRLRERWPTTAITRKRPTEAPLDRIPLFQGADVISGVDVLEFERVNAVLTELRPDVLVNCVGVIKQRSEAKSAIPSIAVNSLLPHRLADTLDRWGGRLVHFSTDCVFSGRRGSYREEDQSDAEDLYGKTKFLGEVATPNSVTLRTSIIGRELAEHRSLLDWFLSQRGNSVRGFTRAIYSGIPTTEMARVVELVIELKMSGLFQVVSTPITKYDLLMLIREAYALDVRVEPDDTFVLDRSMIGDRFEQAAGWRAPDWPVMVREMAADPTPYDAWGTSVL